MATMKNWKLSAHEVLKSGPVIAVIVIHNPDHAVPLANALLSGGVQVLEITLRTPFALEAIQRIANEVPDAIVGAGTVTNESDLRRVTDAGAVFAISPGLTPNLLTAGINGSIALIPGISTASELMFGMEHGLRDFKFFPAAAAGGVKMLQSLGGPFPQARFCPTGGISLGNYMEYLNLDNVACVGGSWLAPGNLIQQEDWQQITALSQQAVSQTPVPE